MPFQNKTVALTAAGTFVKFFLMSIVELCKKMTTNSSIKIVYLTVM